MTNILKRCLIAAIAVTSSVGHIAASEQCDTVQPSYHFKATQLIAPVALIGVGAWGASGGWIHSLDKDINRDFHFGGTNLLDHALEFTPLAADILLGVAGVKTPYSLRDRVISAVTAMVIVEGSVQTVKHSVTVRRPDGSDTHSFPSGHSAVAFMGAELTRIHYGNLWGLGAYGVATATALLRIGHQRHWMTDVVAGAGFGILSARAAMWLLPLERRLFNRYRNLSPSQLPSTATVIAPFAAPAGAGIALVHTF